MKLHMAVGVQEHSVFPVVCASFASPDQMMAMPSGELGDSLVAQWAEAILFLPKVQQSSFPSQVLLCFHVQTFFKVHFPGWVERVGCSLNGCMSLDFHIRCTP